MTLVYLLRFLDFPSKTNILFINSRTVTTSISPINFNKNRQSPNLTKSNESEEENACGVDNSLLVEIGDVNMSCIDTNKTIDDISKLSVSDSNKKSNTKSRDGHLTKLSQNLDNFSKKINSVDCPKSVLNKRLTMENVGQSEDGNREDNKTPTKNTTIQSWNWVEDNQPIECEEWLAFLQKSMQEIMNGELGSLCQPNLTIIIITPLKNANSSCRVMEYVACLLSLPFVVSEVSEETLSQIINVYLNVKVIPYLIYGSKLLMKQKNVSTTPRSNDTTPTPTNTPIPSQSTDTYKSVSDLSADELQALEYIYLLICRLIHHDNQFIGQFCDSIVLLHATTLIQQLLLLCKNKQCSFAIF